MNQQEFVYTYEKFTQRRKEVLQRLLQGETDISIAESMGIGQTTVRKHIERTSQEFGLDDKNQLGRRSRRSELVALFAKYKPELLSNHTYESRKDVEVEVIETIEVQQPIAKTFLLTKSLVNQTAQFEDKEKFYIFFQQYIFRHISQYNLIMQFQECCSKAEKIKLANLLNKEGVEYYQEMDLRQANLHLDWAIEFNSDFPEAHYNLGLVYEAKNDLEQARHHYNKATTIPGKENNHGAFAAINNLSRLLIIQDSSQSQTAIEMIEPILLQVQDQMIKTSLFKNLGWAYFQQENYKQAKQYLLKSLELDPNYAPAHCLLAKVLESENDKEAALDFWNKFLKSYSDKTRSYKYLPELMAWKTDALRALKADNT